MAEGQEKKGTTVTVVCDANGSKCTICGAFIPEGDIACGNGHILGRKYEVLTPNPS